MRRPLVIVAILYAAGLCLAEYIQAPLKQVFIAAGIVALLALIWPKARAWLLVPLLILTGWCSLTSRTAVLADNDLRSLLPNEPALIHIRGKLTETPSVRMFIRDEEPSYRTLAQVEVVEIRLNDGWQPAQGRIMTTTPGDLNKFAYGGAEVELFGVVDRPPGPVADGLFDYRNYLKRQGIYYQLRTAGASDWAMLTPAAPGLSDRFIAWSQATLAKGQPERDQPLLLLYAMTLGWKTGLASEVYEPFMHSGTMHIFAISGLHVALIAGILIALLRLIRIPRRWCGLAVVPLLWFYTAATGWQPSAIRASIMMSVIILGWITARPTDLINSLAAAALLILIWEPQQLFLASFQLSFCVVLSIALLTPPIEKLCNKLLAHDPLIPREALPWWRRWAEPPLRWLALSVATSLAAWLGSLPLTIYYFHIFSPVTLLANLLVVPMSGFALASCLGSLICGDYLPVATEWFNHGAWFWMNNMMQVSHWAAGLPHAFRYVAIPPLWSFAAYYVLLIGILSGWFFRLGNRVWLLFTVFIITCAGYWEWQRTQDTIEITVLPLQGGHAVYVDAPGTADDWLIDCGNESSVEFATKPFLHAKGVNTLPRLLLTHGDLQHIGGAKLLWDEFNVGKTHTSPVNFRSSAYRDLMQQLDAAPERHVELSRNDKVGQWTVLHPAADDKFTQGDDGCLVLQARLHKTRILLLGDLGRPGQELLMQRYPYLDADVVVTGLPEKGEPMCNGLIASSHPKQTIVADSEFPATKRASRVLKERLSEMGARPVFTRDRGAVTVTITPEGFKTRAVNKVD